MCFAEGAISCDDAGPRIPPTRPKEATPGDGRPEVQRFGWTYRIGDRVIQTENDYDKDVFNGDLGVVENINRVEQDMVVNFEGRSVEYDFGDLDELSLAYVLSIHKSQGSEYGSSIHLK